MQPHGVKGHKKLFNGMIHCHWETLMQYIPV